MRMFSVRKQIICLLASDDKPDLRSAQLYDQPSILLDAGSIVVFLQTESPKYFKSFLFCSHVIWMHQSCFYLLDQV